MHNLTNNNLFTDPVQVLDDGDPVAASESQPTAQALTNRTFYTNSLLGQLLGLQSTTTSGTPLTLTAASNERQYFSGSANQTINLPDETTLPTGKTFFVFQNSTGILTFKDSGGSTILTVPPKLTSLRYQLVMLTSVNNATPTGNWKYFYNVPGQLQGTNTNDAAAAGYVGEIIAGTGGGFFGSSGGFVTCVTLPNLTAGAWRLSAQGQFAFSGPSGVVRSTVAWSTATGSFAGSPVSFDWHNDANATAGGMNFSFTMTPQTISLNTTTTLYVVAQVFWSSGNCQVANPYGQAERAR